MVLIFVAILYWFDTGDFEIVDDDEIADEIEIVDDDCNDEVEIIDDDDDDNDVATDEVEIIDDDDDDDDGNNVATDEVEIIDDGNDVATDEFEIVDDDGDDDRNGDDVDDNAFSFESFVSKKLYNFGDANMPPATLSLVCVAIGLGKESVEISFLNGDSETSSLRFFPFWFFLRFTSGT